MASPLLTTLLGRGIGAVEKPSHKPEFSIFFLELYFKPKFDPQNVVRCFVLMQQICYGANLPDSLASDPARLRKKNEVK